MGQVPADALLGDAVRARAVDQRQAEIEHFVEEPARLRVALAQTPQLVQQPEVASGVVLAQHGGVPGHQGRCLVIKIQCVEPMARLIALGLRPFVIACKAGNWKSVRLRVRRPG